MARFLVLTLLLVSPLVASQGIYRTTDEDGNVIFTDAPPANTESEEVGLQPTNRAPPPPNVPALDRSEGAGDEAEKSEYEVVIVKPPSETTIPMGPGNFSVSASVNPSLKKYDSLQLFMDGEPWGSHQASGFWDLTNVFRGAHDITVGVINGEGETVGMSEPVRVYVQRPSVNFRN